MNLNVPAAIEQPAKRRVDIAVVGEAAGSCDPDTELIDPTSRFAVVFNIHGERIARATIDGRRSREHRTLAVGLDVHERDGRAVQVDAAVLVLEFEIAGK